MAPKLSSVSSILMRRCRAASPPTDPRNCASTLSSCLVSGLAVPSSRLCAAAPCVAHFFALAIIPKTAILDSASPFRGLSSSTHLTSSALGSIRSTGLVSVSPYSSSSSHPPSASAPPPLPPHENPPDATNPDPVTLQDQWRYATRMYSRWYAHAWGSAILAGLSFFALGWLVKGENPLPFSGRKDKEEEDKIKGS